MVGDKIYFDNLFLNVYNNNIQKGNLWRLNV